MQLKILLKRPLRPSSAAAETRNPDPLSVCSVLFSCCSLVSPPPSDSGAHLRHATATLLQRRRKMEVEMQLDDDVFFAELSKRISLLITDDDEADFAAAQFPGAAALQLPPGFSMALPHVPHQGASLLAPPAYTLFHHAASYGATNSAGDAGRAWQQQPQQQQKGTGVFIPRSTPGSAHSKRKGRNWSGSKAQKARAQAEGVVAAGTTVKRRA